MVVDKLLARDDIVAHQHGENSASEQTITNLTRSEQTSTPASCSVGFVVNIHVQ